MIRRRAEELRLALMMLTRLPVGRLSDPAPTLREAAWAYPFVGLLVGALAWLVMSIAFTLGAPTLVSAVLAISAAALVTGALHFDGLADVADGLGGGRDKAHSLEIMRDSRIGSYGTLALICAVLLLAASIAGHGRVPPISMFLLMACASRFMMTALTVVLPSAREDGLGKMSSQVSKSALLPGAVLVAAFLYLAGLPSAIALVLMCLAAGATAFLAMRRIGGQTGDVLGAVQVLSLVFGWIGWAALASPA
jgi:adenosylcobinamide-GDP ribazoletransferase